MKITIKKKCFILVKRGVQIAKIENEISSEDVLFDQVEAERVVRSRNFGFDSDLGYIIVPSELPIDIEIDQHLLDYVYV